MSSHIWGVQSKKTASSTFYQCIQTNFGHPKFWGRYLSKTTNEIDSLSKEELAFLKKAKIRLLPLYEISNHATGYHQGRIAATNALFRTRQLGIPRGTVLFADVHSKNIDDRWVEAWVETIYRSGYKSGFYINRMEHFATAFSKAAIANDRVEKHCVLWGTEPSHGPTKSTEAPPFQATPPSHACNLWIWGYGKDVENCTVRTCLASTQLLPFLRY